VLAGTVNEQVNWPNGFAVPEHAVVPLSETTTERFAV